MASQGSVVYGSDYNAVVAKLTQVLGSGSPYGPGTGTPTWGYNQTLASSVVSPGALVTAAQWNNLITDVNKVYTHVNGSAYSFTAATQGQPISYSELSTINTVLNAFMSSPPTTAASGQLQQSTMQTTTYGSTWGGGKNGITQTGTITFPSTTAMQYFLNQGGYMAIVGIPPTSNSTTQTTDWINAINAFSYTFNAATVATLTGTATQVYYTANQPSPYSANYIKLNASISGAVISWQVYYIDDHQASGAGPDSVNSGAGVYVYQYQTSGAFTGYTTSASSVGSWATVAG
jgi:hypothetical protein